MRIGPVTTQISWFWAAMVRTADSSLLQMPALKVCVCGLMLDRKKHSSMAWADHFWSAAGIRWPLS